MHRSFRRGAVAITAVLLLAGCPGEPEAQSAPSLLAPSTPVTASPEAASPEPPSEPQPFEPEAAEPSQAATGAAGGGILVSGGVSATMTQAQCTTLTGDEATVVSELISVGSAELPNFATFGFDDQGALTIATATLPDGGPLLSSFTATGSVQLEGETVVVDQLGIGEGERALVFDGSLPCQFTELG